jgi:uncharacterized protein YcbX
MGARDSVGTVVSLWRYPVKSMQGEELNASVVGQRGFLGDRAHALIDVTDGKIASAKNPRKWPNLFDFRAAYVEPPAPDDPLPPVRITLPGGDMLASGNPDIDTTLSHAIGRAVRLCAVAPAAPVLEEYWPDIEGLSHRDAITSEAMSKDTFFDCAVIHLLTTATLARLREHYPKGLFEVRRFRPNLVVAPPASTNEFVENGWLGHTLRVGSEVRLRITGPCGRCVMTTLAQAELPKDAGILSTAARVNKGQVGLYVEVIRPGVIRRGDVIVME